MIVAVATVGALASLLTAMIAETWTIGSPTLVVTVSILSLVLTLSALLWFAIWDCLRKIAGSRPET